MTRDHRWLAPLLTILGVGLCYGLSVRHAQAPWRFMGVVPMSLPWADTAIITAASESSDRGFDPLVSNPEDARQRRLNYPRTWRLLFLLGLDRTDTAWLAAAFLGGYAAGVCALLLARPARDALAILLAAHSPAALFGLERGNSDLLIFGLVVLAVLLLEKRRAASLLVLAAGALLKVYPILALPAFVRGARRGALWLAACFGLLCLLDLHELRAMAAATARGAFGAYGSDVLALGFATPLAGWSARAAALSGLLRATSGARFGSAPDTTATRLFAAGASIYLGTFVLGANWNYRLIFLTLCVPALLDQAREAKAALPRLALGGIYVCLWQPFLQAHVLPIEAAFVVGQCATWGLFVALAALLPAALPGSPGLPATSPGR